MQEYKEKVDNYEFHNRNLIRTEEHLSISVNNDHSNLDALNKRQNPKIEPSNSKSTDRIYSGLYEDPRLQCIKTVNQRNNCTKPLIKNSQKITEQKNEILSRTFDLPRIKKLLLLFFYCVLIFLLCNTRCGVDSAPVKSNETSSLTDVNQELTNNDRTFSYNGNEHSLAKRHARIKPKKMINKNCKEYDITSRAYLADLIFEGTARSRSPNTSPRDEVTFVIRRVLKQKKNAFAPKMQIRIHFGTNRKLFRTSLTNDCPINSITNSKMAKANVKFGKKYYVFADVFGPTNYTAKGEPIVSNKRNLKSIRSVLSKNREKPPRVRGLQNLTRSTNSELRLTCNIRGRPVPRIAWYKDGAPLIPSSHVNVTFYRKNSTVEIKSVKWQDRGVYECRAISVMGESASMKAYVSVSQNTTTSTTTDSDWPMHADKCEVDAFCLNGGKCRFISTIGEHMCMCEVGYKGARCERKDASTREFYPDGVDGNMHMKKIRRIRGHTITWKESPMVALYGSSSDHAKLRHRSQKNHRMRDGTAKLLQNTST